MKKRSRRSFRKQLLASAILLGVCAWIATPDGQQQPGPTAAPYVSGEILVKFRQTAITARRNAVLAGEGARLIRRLDQLDLHRIGIRQGESVENAVAAFASKAEVMLVQPNYIRHIVATGPPNDPYWLNNSLWGLQKIMAQPTWNNFPTGDRTVVVADIDTGVNYNHPDLIANMWHNPGEIAGNGVDDDGDGFVDDVYGIDTVNHDSDPMDDHGHGTHTSGTIGGVGNNGIGVVGVNQDVKILACKFLDAGGSGSDGDAAACFNYIVMLKNRGINIRVSNNSWGAPRGLGPPAAVLKDAIDAAGAAGILNAVAAGNDGVSNDLTPHDPASFTSPSVVSVAASDGSDNMASFSNYGVISVDLAAPGVGIWSTTGNGYASWSGTSMATPHVAGAAAFLASQKPTMSVAEIKSLLLSNVDHLGQWSGKVVSGGRLNLFVAAMAAGVNAPPTVSLTGPSGGTMYTAPAIVPLAATASDTNGVSQVDFYANGGWIGQDTTSPYSFSWTNVAPGTYTLTARATDTLGATTTSTGVSVTVTTPVPNLPGTAVFRGSDTTTHGNWRGVYGSQGYGVVYDSASFPAYAQMSTTGPLSTWATATSDARALQRASGSGRVAACVCGGGSFALDLNLTDGLTHQVALYVLDWDTTTRAQRIDVIDAVGGALLDTRSVAGFQGGRYLVWTLSGHVTVLVTNTGVPTAAISGVFLDPPTGPATVTMTGPATGTVYAAPATIPLAATVTPPPGRSVTGVDFLNGTSVIGSAASAPYTLSWANVPAGTYTLTARAIDNLGATATSAGVSITVTTPPTVRLTGPSGPTTLAAPATVVLAADASDTDGTVNKVDFYANGGLIGTDATSPYTFNWTNVTPGTYTLTATATDNLGVTTTSAGVPVTVASAAGATAVFRSLDTATQGNWRAVYGSQGAGVVYDSGSFPSYAQVTTAGTSLLLWTSSSSDPRAMQRASGTGRVAGCLCSAGSFTIDLNFTDGLAHQLAVYVLDWDTTARAQRMDVLNATNGAVLDTRSVSGFQAGKYLVWTVSGHVTLRVTNTGPTTAVVSGVFLNAAP